MVLYLLLYSIIFLSQFHKTVFTKTSYSIKFIFHQFSNMIYGVFLRICIVLSTIDFIQSFMLCSPRELWATFNILVLQRFINGSWVISVISFSPHTEHLNPSTPLLEKWNINYSIKLWEFSMSTSTESLPDFHTIISQSFISKYYLWLHLERVLHKCLN